MNIYSKKPIKVWHFFPNQIEIPVQNLNKNEFIEIDQEFIL